MLADARAMGATALQVEALRGAIEREDGRADELGVWPQHWHAFKVFTGMATQWRCTAVGTVLLRTGLDYAGLPPVLLEHQRMPRRIRQPHRRLMRQLRTLERAAVSAFNTADD